MIDIENSMGGLLIADATLSIKSHSRSHSGNGHQSNVPLWPRIVGMIAFDTPVSIRKQAIGTVLGDGKA